MVFPLSISTHLFFCHEEHPNQLLEFTCMYHFLGIDIGDGITVTPGFICNMDGIGCNEHQVVERIDLKENDAYLKKQSLYLQYDNYNTYEEYDITWIPPSVTYVVLEKIVFSYTALDTRLLPPPLERLSVRHANLSGSVDLRSLPCKMVSLDLSYTLISGTVRLTSLPVTMEELRMNENKLRRVVVLNDLLPPSFQKGEFIQRKLKLISSSGDDIDNRIRYSSHR